MYCLTRKTHRCNSLVQKMCMFLQKETSHCKSSLALGPQRPKHYIFADHFYLKKAKRPRFHVFLLFDARKYMISSFYLKWTEFTRNSFFLPIMGPRGPELTWNKFTISYKFGPLPIKGWYHMFCSIKMDEYIESEPSGIFWVKLIAKYIVLGCPGTHFMHMGVIKQFSCINVCDKKMNLSESFIRWSVFCQEGYKVWESYAMIKFV